MTDAFNVLDARHRPDPYPIYAALRELGPLVRNPSLGLWTATAHATAQRILRDHDTFSSDFAQGGALHDLLGAPTMLFSDPPAHDRLRGVVSPAFAKRTTSGLGPAIAALAEKLLAPGLDGGTFDVVTEVSEPLPVIVIADLLDVPNSDRDDFRRWSDGAIAVSDVALTPSDEQTAALGELLAYFASVIDHRRRHPGDDLISLLIEANHIERLSDAELGASCVLLLVAGSETTTNLLSNLVLALTQRPEPLAGLDPDDDASLAGAVEETLRFDPTVQAVMRLARERVEVDGTVIDPGELVMILTAGANRDPAVFEDPDTFDIGRADANRQLSFGHGIHHCVGAHLARIEVREVLRALVRGCAHVALAQPHAERSYRSSFFLRGLASLPVIARAA